MQQAATLGPDKLVTGSKKILSWNPHFLLFFGIGFPHGTPTQPGQGESNSSDARKHPSGTPSGSGVWPVSHALPQELSGGQALADRSQGQCPLQDILLSSVWRLRNSSLPLNPASAWPWLRSEACVSCFRGTREGREVGRYEGRDHEALISVGPQSEPHLPVRGRGSSRHSMQSAEAASPRGTSSGATSAPDVATKESCIKNVDAIWFCYCTPPLPLTSLPHFDLGSLSRHSLLSHSSLLLHASSLPSLCLSPKVG